MYISESCDLGERDIRICRYFHNAYFLRVVHSVLRNCSFLASTGHGLKITQQNDTLIEDCRIMDNRWCAHCLQ